MGSYKTLRTADLDLSRLDKVVLGGMAIEVIDPVTEYADLMESLFDFDLIRSAVRTAELRPCFDAMHAVTGPYGQEIFQRRLGAGAGGRGETRFPCRTSGAVIPTPTFSTLPICGQVWNSPKDLTSAPPRMAMGTATSFSAPGVS